MAGSRRPPSPGHAVAPAVPNRPFLAPHRRVEQLSHGATALGEVPIGSVGASVEADVRQACSRRHRWLRSATCEGSTR